MVIISRFLMNLRRAQALPVIASRATRFTIPGFRVPTDFLGNIGASLDHEPCEGGEEQLDGDVQVRAAQSSGVQHDET